MVWLPLKQLSTRPNDIEANLCSHCTAFNNGQNHTLLTQILTCKQGKSFKDIEPPGGGAGMGPVIQCWLLCSLKHLKLKPYLRPDKNRINIYKIWSQKFNFHQCRAYRTSDPNMHSPETINSWYGLVFN